MALPRLDETAPDPALAALLTASGLAAAILDGAASDARIVFANPAFLVLTGHGVGDAVSCLLGPDHDRGARTLLEQALAGEKPGGAEILAFAEGGSTFWAQLFVANVAGSGLRLMQVVDVTRRRDAEGALALSRQREALGLLTNSVAHEFNNFLQILIGYIDGLKRRLGDREDPFIQRAVTRSTDAAERATILTRQLLAFSRRIAPDVRPVDLNRLIEDFGAQIRPTLPTRIVLDITTAPVLSAGLSNPTQVELALNHIVANACEAMPKAGRITIATFAVPPGDRGLQRPGDGAVGISITDDGQGMTQEMAARALAPFITSREAGRGTGLAIVHGLMKRQNGTVSLDSSPGSGTVVRLIFPAAI
ncbi:PAS domain-containing sensor histidine kinase [Methylobacterium sp. BTF04]|uniref:ATP-binding protein n=1 Tax=Methylobacterium sp. BTF04 TaxID=2708300 RepID=UPI0013D8ABB8|nr:ATP-binding protein [Methylobacterium sp. BTF04]NEU13834.1 PAS domain-containing sensor histidine kinase [Methylobacterium sp. BTF04]